MRRAPAWIVAVGVLVGWAASPPAAHAAGVWVTLAAGLPGASAPSSQSEFWFDTVHGPPAVAVSELSGGTTAQAVTGGGVTTFGGLGLPVLLNLADGSAYVAGGSPPSSATTNSGPHGGSAGTPASAAPVPGGTLPSDASLLGINLADPDATGARGLTATVTDPAGNVLGTGTVTVPGGGYFVLGLTPGANTTPDPGTGGTDGGSGNNGGGDGGGGTDPTTPPPVTPPPVTPPPVTPPASEGGGPVATPEPSTLALVGIGGVAAAGWRRIKARKAA